MAAIHGRGVTPYGALVIADDYRLAGDVLGGNARTRDSMPRRLVYLHAIEGYLRAYLLLTGATPELIRDYRHDLETMATACAASGLSVSKNTVRFIKASAADGDYVRARYDTGLDYRGADWPPPPRPNASLKLLKNAVEDLALVVTNAIEQSLEAGTPISAAPT